MISVQFIKLVSPLSRFQDSGLIWLVLSPRLLLSREASQQLPSLRPRRCSREANQQLVSLRKFRPSVARLKKRLSTQGQTFASDCCAGIRLTLIILSITVNDCRGCWMHKQKHLEATFASYAGKCTISSMGIHRPDLSLCL